MREFSTALSLFGEESSLEKERVSTRVLRVSFYEREVQKGLMERSRRTFFSVYLSSSGFDKQSLNLSIKPGSDDVINRVLLVVNPKLLVYLLWDVPIKGL